MPEEEDNDALQPRETMSITAIEQRISDPMANFLKEVDILDPIANADQKQDTSIN